MATMGARGQANVADAVLAYTESTKTDARMLLHDIWGSEAHALMLARQGILTDDDLRRILEPLEHARADAEAGTLALDPKLEDVHMNVESYVIRAVGREYGGKLHTARSRNDQVITDARLYIREELLAVEERTVDLSEAFLTLARMHGETVLPGYTHTQHAQPITLAFWATAHASLLAEDLRRLRSSYATVNRNPLGACALAGTSFPTDRHLTTRLLGFDATQEHALAVVSGRDFILESVFALSMLMTNLSRLAEEVILWTTFEFRTVALDDAYALGSSIMPQKKNPDIAELTRGRTGKIYGRLMEALTMLKGLPLGYHRDLQEDKPLLWECFDTVKSALTLMKELIFTWRVDKERMLELTFGNFSTATELANHLVEKGAVSFRESHEIVGSLVRHLSSQGLTFRDLSACCEFLATRGHVYSVETLRDVLDPVAAVNRNRSVGGASPREVARMTDALAFALERHTHSIQTRRKTIEEAHAETTRCVAAILRGETVTTVFSNSPTSVEVS